MPRIKKADYELLAAFRRELRNFFAFSEQVAQATGMSAQQYQALLAIKGYSGREQVTVGELAQELLLVHHSASELADRMVSNGLLERSVADASGRSSPGPHGSHSYRRAAANTAFAAQAVCAVRA
jgi:hypothetical protein